MPVYPVSLQMVCATVLLLTKMAVAILDEKAD